MHAYVHRYMNTYIHTRIHEEHFEHLLDLCHRITNTHAHIYIAIAVAVAIAVYMYVSKCIHTAHISMLILIATSDKPAESHIHNKAL